MSGALCEWSAVWSPGKEWNTSAGPWSWGRSSKKNDDVLSLHTNSIEKVWSLCFMLLFLCTYIYIDIYIDIHRYLHIIHTQGINDYIYKWYNKEIHIYIYTHIYIYIHIYIYTHIYIWCSYLYYQHDMALPDQGPECLVAFGRDYAWKPGELSVGAGSWGISLTSSWRCRYIMICIYIYVYIYVYICIYIYYIHHILPWATISLYIYIYNTEYNYI